MNTPRSPMEALFPPFGLRLACGRLTMRAIREDDVPEIMDAVARVGIYDDGRVFPFLHDWPSEAARTGGLSSMRYYWRCWAEWTPERWALPMRVEVDGQFVGCQDLMASNFVQTRAAETGSWLLLNRQGEGIGTLMRQVMCTFAIDSLGAAEMTSGAIAGNGRSLGVSRRVGYEANGVRRILSQDGTGWREEQVVRLVPERLVRPADPVEVSGLGAFRRSIGLDA